ncbi:MAG: SDR family oxidoreductase [Synergistaceae bacterium]|nr:SDR family oxidoreductase [Synergistaceae bacterium]
MEKKITFIFSATIDSLNYILPECGNGSLVFFTADTEKAAAGLVEFCAASGVEAFPYICSDKNLAAIAPAVIGCADKFGGIDTLIFDVSRDDKTSLFLDITEEEFVFYTNAINEFHSLCRCALPYMLGRDGASVIARAFKEPSGAAQAAYNGAVSEMVKAMRGEFENFGVKVETVIFQK